MPLSRCWHSVNILTVETESYKMISRKSESDFNETIPHCASTNENPIEIYKLLETKGASFTKEMI